MTMSFILLIVAVAGVEAAQHEATCNVPEGTSDSLGLAAYLDCQSGKCEDFDDSFFQALVLNRYPSCAIAIPELQMEGLTCESDVPPSMAPGLPTGSESKKFWQLCGGQCKDVCDLASAAKATGKSGGTCPEGNITEFVIGFTGTVTNTNWADLYTMAIIDFDFRKHFEPELVEKYGAPVFPIENLNPCLRMRPIYLDNSGYDTSTTDAVSLWNFGNMAYGLNGFPAISGLAASECQSCLEPLSAFAAQAKIPVAIYSEQTALDDKVKYPYTLRMSPSAVLQADLIWFYFEHFRFKNAVLVYETSNYGMGMYDRFMQMAAEASRTGAIFPFSITLDRNGERSSSVAGNIVDQIEPLPARLIILLCHTQALDAMYLELEPRGVWMPKYQILSSERHVFTRWATTPPHTKVIDMVTKNHTLHFSWALADYGAELVNFFMMSLKFTAETVLNETNRYMLNKWHPELETRIGDIQETQRFFGAPEWRSSIHSSNAYVMYARAFNSLMNAGVPAKDMKGETLKRALMNVTFCGMAICPFKFKANQDQDFGWSINSLCLNGNDRCAGSSIDGLAGPSSVNFAAFMTLKGGRSSITGTPFRWGNGEFNEDVPEIYGACQPGQYLTEEGFCKACSQGWSSPTFDSNNCTACAPGRYVKDFGAECATCAPGRGSSESGATACAACVPGQFSPGGEPCQTCEEGTFSDNFTAFACTSCSSIQEGSSSPAAATSSTDCACGKGYYDVHLGESSLCQPCLEGMTCSGGGHPPLLEKGFYVAPEAPLDVQKIDVWKCMSEKACPGQTSASDSPCGAHMTGINCGLCEDDYSRNGDKCEPCGSASWALIIISPVILWFIAGGFSYLWNNQASHVEAFESVLGSVTLGMVISFLQTLGVFNRLRLNWPDEFKALLEICSFFLFDIELLKPACIVPSTLGGSYISKLCLPLLVALIFASWQPASRIFNKMTKGWYRALTWSGTWNTIGMVALGFYISLVSSTVSLVECYSNPNGAKTLRGYPFAVCGDEAQHQLIPVFVLALLFYVVGTLCLFIYLLIVAPNNVSKADFRRGIRFLIFKFHPNSYWFALSLVIRSLCLALIPVISPDDSYVQFLMTCVVVVFAIVAHMAYMPYSDKFANYLEASELCLLLLILFFGSWFMEDRDFDGEDKNTADLLTVLLLLSLAICVILLGSVFIFAIFLASFPKRAMNMHINSVKSAMPSLLSACKVIVGTQEDEVYDLLMKSSYRDRSIVFQFSDFVLIEIAGLVAKGHSHRRLPSTDRRMLHRDDTTLERTVSDAVNQIKRTFSTNSTQETNQLGDAEKDNKVEDPGLPPDHDKLEFMI